MTTVEWTNDDIDRYIVADIGFIPDPGEALHTALLRLINMPETKPPQYVSCTTIMNCSVGYSHMVDGFLEPMVDVVLPRHSDVVQVLEIGGSVDNTCYLIETQTRETFDVASDDYLFMYYGRMSMFQFLVPVAKVQIVDNRVAVRVRCLVASIPTLAMFDNQTKLVYRQYVYQAGSWSLGGGGGGTKAAVQRQQ